MPKLTITQGKDGLFHARVFGPVGDNGKRPSKRISGHSPKEVEKKAEEYLAEMKKNSDTFHMTLEEAARKYIEYLTTRQKPLSPSTQRTYQGYARNHFKDLQKLPIFEITEQMIQEEIYDLEGEVSAKTIQNAIHFYVACIHHFRRGFNPDLDLPEKDEPNIKIPDSEILKTKIPTIKNKRLLLPVLLAAYCGLRRSEIAALDLTNDIEYDVRLSNNNQETDNENQNKIGLIHVSRALVRGPDDYILKGPKTRAGTRTVIMPGWLNDVVKEFRDDKDYVSYPPHKISNAFAEWAKKENIGCSFHGLRHYYASLGEALNIPDLYMMNMMGHSTPYMLQKYKEIMRDKQTEVNETFVKFLADNSPFAPQNAPSKNINKEKERK